MADMDFSELLLKRNRKIRPLWPDLRQGRFDFVYDFGVDPLEAREGLKGHIQEFVATKSEAELLDPLLKSFPDNFEDLDCSLVAKAHGWYLYRHLELFAHARSQEKRDEYLAWFVLPPSFHGIDLDLSRVDPLRVPFSFELCCWFEEREPERLRSAVVDLNLQLQGKPLRRS